MKRNRGSESKSALVPNSSDNKNQENNPMKDLETMLEGMDDDEESSCQVLSEKKRRLHIDQVRALEANFKVDNKLDPDRKVKLAREVGLQPRQVAIWFQNRRARLKTKQLEKDYVSLKANYDALSIGFEKLRQENESLLREISKLKSSSEQWELLPDTEEKTKLESPDKREEGTDELNLNKFSESILCIKDGTSDSDSSAIFNDDNNNHHLSGDDIYCKNMSFAYTGNGLGDAHKFYLQQPFVKIDFLEDESCGSLIFADEQAPPLHWYLE